MLTAMGWIFADAVRSGRFEAPEQAAAWLERNLAESGQRASAASDSHAASEPAR